jgi:hypothetical protein
MHDGFAWFYGRRRDAPPDSARLDRPRPAKAHLKIVQQTQAIWSIGLSSRLHGTPVDQSRIHHLYESRMNALESGGFCAVMVGKAW